MQLRSATGSRLAPKATVIDLQSLLSFDPILGFDSVLMEIEAAMGSGRALPLREAFDPQFGEGWVSFIADAADAPTAQMLVPLVVEFDLPLTLFVRTCAVESGTWIDHRREPMTWAALDEAAAVGIELGTCGHGLDPWRSCDSANISVSRSAALFEARLGRELAAVACHGASVEVQLEISRFTPTVLG